MPKFCCVIGCHNSFSKENITSHRFPDAEKSPELHALWMENINKNVPVEFTPIKGSRVCSEHFSVDMMQKVGQRTMLLPYAIPTIFEKSQVISQNVEHVEVASKDIAIWMTGRDCVSTQEVPGLMVSEDIAVDLATGSTGKVVVPGVSDKKVSSHNVSVQGKELTTDNVITHGRKRKPSDEDFDEMAINGVSTPKRIHASHVNHDHTYHISESPRKMKKNVDNLVNNLTNLQKKFNVKTKNKKAKEKG
ncbi:uncharacterized protein LOC114524672 [Dendronephthya gigantea]|uniref:uncharacterized protein LOC114524672 n=1 Tax=Dendronephthya gigantea TaxID=151771 RepID=UPI001069A975|nr:uncharacterized protein LOC114524672 [Dendronephthya gigantea]